MDVIIVVGLGNPGTEYDGTRHNIGFEVVDELARRFKLRMKVGVGEYVSGLHKMGGKHLVFAKPMTYMNNSGTAVRELLETHGVTPGELIVIADDVALPLGSIRVRTKGSDGGHNGLHSIIYQLVSDEFPRIRCGIRPEVKPSKEEMAEFVLSPFEQKERERVDDMISRSADAVLEFAVDGIASTMNKFNTRLQDSLK